ncbi:ABC transporter permease [Streptomyces sp. NPDC051954]|uniref:ABC transporter permease n=1 Tax=Streptomyces sp. NPDC051954 TaxID=3155524 RepID=UPI00341B6C4D
MNFVKRAGMSLGARRSKTTALLAIFLVICTLLLGGFLLQAAAGRQEADAQRTIGVDVTVRKKGLTPALTDRLGALDMVHRYNAELAVQAATKDFAPLTSKVPEPGGAAAGKKDKGALAVNGVRDSGMLLPFSYGSTKITAGRGITPDDEGRDVAVIEQRLAAKNRLEVGDTVQVESTDGKHTSAVKVVGIFQDPAQDPTMWVAPHELPGNTLYVPAGIAKKLTTGTATVREAVLKIGSPDQARQLHADVEHLLGRGGFEFRVNDKSYRDQVRPIQRVGTFAGLIVWVIALAGALILGLIVMLQIRERRAELGVLLSMGENKWKLIGQHAVEVAAVTLPAVALAALAGSLTGQSAGDAFLGRQNDTPVSAARAPDTGIAPPTVRVEAADVGKVAGIALGISLVSTVIPGIGILRLHPRSILTDTE